jgi:short-subunit dehydrogenase
MKKTFKLTGKRSHLINLSSQTIFGPYSYFFTYGATKIFNHTLSRSLMEELRPLGVDVMSVQPNLV